MIKHGAVIAGETPSEVSGRKSQVIKQGSAVRFNEKPTTAESDFHIKLVSMGSDDETMSVNRSGDARTTK